MSIKAQISVLKETVTGEARVALSPETAKKFKGLGFDVVVQSGAGDLSSFSDDAYKDAGAKVAKTAKDAVKGADIILKLRTPSDD